MRLRSLTRATHAASTDAVVLKFDESWALETTEIAFLEANAVYVCFVSDEMIFLCEAFIAMRARVRFNPGVYAHMRDEIDFLCETFTAFGACMWSSACVYAHMPDE